MGACHNSFLVFVSNRVALLAAQRKTLRRIMCSLAFLPAQKIYAPLRIYRRRSPFTYVYHTLQ
jgi:hypothetical protein